MTDRFPLYSLSLRTDEVDRRHKRLRLVGSTDEGATLITNHGLSHGAHLGVPHLSTNDDLGHLRTHFRCCYRYIILWWWGTCQGLSPTVMKLLPRGLVGELVVPRTGINGNVLQNIINLSDCIPHIFHVPLVNLIRAKEEASLRWQNVLSHSRLQEN